MTFSHAINRPFFILLIVSAVLLNSCENPMDIPDTKVHVDKPQAITVPVDSIELQSIEAIDNPETLSRTFRFARGPVLADSSDAFLCRIDTSNEIPKLTLHASLVPTGEKLDVRTYAVQRLMIRIDSMPLDGDVVRNLCTGQMTAFVLAYKRINGRTVEVMDTVQLHRNDDYNYAYLSQNLLSSKRGCRLSLDFSTLSETLLDGKARLCRLRAVAKLRY